MAGKSIEERMAATETRIRQLEAQKRFLTQQVKEQERKERTRRLIQIGSIMARLGVDTVEKAQTLQEIVEGNPELGDWFRQICSSSSTR